MNYFLFSVAKCICRAYLTNWSWNTPPSKHGSFQFTFFLLPWKWSQDSHTHNMGTHKPETPGNIIFSNCLLYPLLHSPQLLQLSTSFLLSSKGVDSYLSFLKIDLFIGIQYHFPVFHIHLSYHLVTQWIIFTWGGLCCTSVPGPHSWWKEMHWDTQEWSPWQGCCGSGPGRSVFITDVCSEDIITPIIFPRSREDFSDKLGYCL